MISQIGIEDQQQLERLVALGRFSSIEEALHACIQTSGELLQSPPRAEWLEYLDRSIDAGLQSAESGEPVPAERVLDHLRGMRTTPQ